LCDDYSIFPTSETCGHWLGRIITRHRQ
jgi:hypothetical protein